MSAPTSTNNALPHLWSLRMHHLPVILTDNFCTDTYIHLLVNIWPGHEFDENSSSNCMWHTGFTLRQRDSVRGNNGGTFTYQWPLILTLLLYTQARWILTDSTWHFASQMAQSMTKAKQLKYLRSMADWWTTVIKDSDPEPCTYSE